MSESSPQNWPKAEWEKGNRAAHLAASRKAGKKDSASRGENKKKNPLPWQGKKKNVCRWKRGGKGIRGIARRFRELRSGESSLSGGESSGCV